MTKLQEIIQDVQFYTDFEIERELGKYEERKYNICIRLENGSYTQEQADRNYERASKIYNILRKEKQRRMLEKDKAYTELLKSMQGKSLGVYKR